MVNLHVHSMFSLRDSIIKPADLAKRVSEIGQKAVAVTDHGGSLGGVTIYKELKDAGIKYIHGVEFYICDDVKVKDKDSKYYHLVALCKNDRGRLNMNRLITMSEHPDNKYFKPRIDFEMLKQHSDGLIIMSACLAGEVSKAIMSDEYDRAEQIARKYQEQFGDDYYIEIQSHSDPEQIKVNRALVALADHLGIEVVVTTDAHYAYEADRMYQNKYAFNGAYKEDGEAYVDCFLQSEREVRDRLHYFTPEQIDRFIGNTEAVSAKCLLEMPLSAPIMPQVDTPEQYPDNETWLHDICKRGFQEKLNIDYDTGKIFNEEKMLIRSILDDDGNEIDTEEYQLSQEQIQTYIERYQYEMNALSKMGFIDYIILVYSYANVGKRRGIARGSGGGSLVNYLSNITNIDPIEHGLYFERFIDVGALSKLESGEITAKELKIPDIDLDFSGESCKEVLRFLFDKYGEDRVASIGRFGTNKTKGTIRDLCKVLELDLATADQIAKSFEHFEIDDIDSMIRGEIPISASAQDAIKNVKHYTELFDYVRKLNGLPKSFGLHPCGRVISVRDLDTFLPSCYDDSGIRFLQGDMHDVEDVGLVKVDVLGLRTLDQEYDTLEMSQQTMEFLDPRQRYTDPKVLDIFRKGDTLGIFQMASPGMKKTLKKMNVSGIEDISVANALFRPGSMQYIDNFCERKAGRESFEYLHPDLEPILRNTYGIIVFQEQLIEIGRMAGLHNPDLLRKATGKKNPKLLAQIKPELEDKLKARGWSDQQFEKLWSDMLDFAKYSFNKCISGSTRFLRPMIRDKVWHPTIEEMYLVKNDLEYAKAHNKLPLRSKYLRSGYGVALSMYEDGRIRKNKIVDIQPSGVRQTITIRTESGAEITCTGNHKFPTPNGVIYAENLSVGNELYCVGEYEKTVKKYNFTGGVFESNIPKPGQRGFQIMPNGPSAIFERKRKAHVANRTPCQLCGAIYNEELRFELHHKDGNRKNNEDDNLCWCCNSCHKADQYRLGRTKTFEKGLPNKVEKVVSIVVNPPEQTYDVTMADPAHNFVVDSGIVTCNSHSSAYGIIAYMTAKQKAYYPAEFFAGLYNSYIGESSFVKDDASDIAADMMRHEVRIKKLSFRDDHRACSVKDGKIIYAIPLIRDSNLQTAEVLHKFSRSDEKFFWRLCRDMMQEGMGKSKLEVLVKLDFFDEFANSKKLLRILDFLEFFKNGERASVKKAQVESSEFLYNIVDRYSTSKNAKGDELKTFKIQNCDAILDELEIYIKGLPLEDFDFKTKIATQREYLGFVCINTANDADRSKLMVKGVFPLHRKKDDALFGYSVVSQSMGSGKESRMTVFKRKFEADPIKEGDLIRCKKWTRDGQYFQMLDYEHIYS